MGELSSISWNREQLHMLFGNSSVRKSLLSCSLLIIWSHISFSILRDINQFHFIYFVAYIVSDLSSGSFFKLAPVSFWRISNILCVCLVSSLLLHNYKSMIILYFPRPTHWISHSSCFGSFVANGIYPTKNQVLSVLHSLSSHSSCGCKITYTCTDLLLFRHLSICVHR